MSIINKKSFLYLTIPYFSKIVSGNTVVFLFFHNCIPTMIYKGSPYYTTVVDCYCFIKDCMKKLSVSNLVTISILQSLLIGCLSLLFSIIHHYIILSNNELKFVTHIFQIFRWVDSNLIYRLYNKGNNKITELRTILRRESQKS